MPVSLCSYRSPPLLKGILRVSSGCDSLRLPFFFTYRSVKPTRKQQPPPSMPQCQARNKPTRKQPPPPTTPQRQPRSNHPHNNHHHLRHYARSRTPSSTDHATTVSVLETVENARRETKKKPPMVRGFFPACFSALGVKERGGAARSRLVDARCDAVGSEERPLFGKLCER